MTEAEINRWSCNEHALEYLKRADSIPHRAEGESTLLECVPRQINRVLDLGSGGGRLVRLLRVERPGMHAVALDFSSVMLEALRDHFRGEPEVEIVEHDLNRPLPHFDPFDAVVSSFAIHHLPHARKRALYSEIYDLLTPGGTFCNLEHVSSPTDRLHRAFLARMDVAPQNEDPSNKLLDLETQLRWLRDLGFDDVDCCWKWRELALLTACKPGPGEGSTSSS